MDIHKDLNRVDVWVYHHLGSNAALMDSHALQTKLSKQAVKYLKDRKVNAKLYQPPPMGGGAGWMQQIIDLFSVVDGIMSFFSAIGTVLKMGKYTFSRYKPVNYFEPRFNISLMVGTDRKFKENMFYQPTQLREIVAAMTNLIPGLVSELSKDFPAINFDAQIDLRLSHYGHTTTVIFAGNDVKRFGKPRLEKIFKGMVFRQNIQSIYKLNRLSLVTREDWSVEKLEFGGTSSQFSKKYYFIFSKRVISDYFRRQIVTPSEY